MKSPQMMSLKTLLAEHTMPAAEPLTCQKDDAVQCFACGHRCTIKPDHDGVCRVRFNAGGQLRVPAGYVAGLAVDPIEKKPFFHAYPGEEALSFGMLGCDLHCSFCQNWITSQTLKDDEAIAQPHFITPEKVVQLAIDNQCPVITSTYNEPLITTEWAIEIMKLGKAEGIVGAYVSNGNATPEVLEFIRPYVDLFKIDLKCFSEKTYRELGCDMNNVLETIKRTRDMGFWVEIVTLIVPGMNDSAEELTKAAEFIAGVSTDIPWHVTAFHPDYRMTDPRSTPPETLLEACKIGQSAGLKFTYPGNLAGSLGDRESTKCPDCGQTLIERRGFSVISNHMVGNTCPNCHMTIPGVWEQNAPECSHGPGYPRNALH